MQISNFIGRRNLDNSNSLACVFHCLRKSLWLTQDLGFSLLLPDLWCGDSCHSGLGEEARSQLLRLSLDAQQNRRLRSVDESMAPVFLTPRQSDRGPRRPLASQ